MAEEELHFTKWEQYRDGNSLDQLNVFSSLVYHVLKD